MKSKDIFDFNRLKNNMEKGAFDHNEQMLNFSTILLEPSKKAFSLL